MIRATYPSYLGPPLRGPSFYGARYCALIRPRGACRLGGEMYEPVRGPWFVVREPPADPPARRSVVFLPRRTVSGCNRQTSHCARFVKTRRSSLRPCSAIRAPWQWVIAHHARLVVGCPRPMRRTRLIPARGFRSPGRRSPGRRSPWFSVLGSRFSVLGSRFKGPIDRFSLTIPMTYRDRSENLARVGEGRWLRLCSAKIIP